LVQYADDSQFIFIGEIKTLPQLITRAEATLTKAKKYFDLNGLQINPQKTQIIFIGTQQYISKIPDDTFINFDGNQLTPSKHVKNLGIIMDQHLTFSGQVDYMYKKVIGKLMYINRIKDQFDKQTRINVVEALILSQINYCISVWGATNKTQLQRVQKLQNFAARVAEGTAGKFDHISPVLEELSWLRINDQYKFSLCCLVWKTLHGMYPDWFLKFPKVSEMNDSITRQANNLYVKPARLTTGKKILETCGPILWNSLPLSIRNVNSLPNFKSKLKNYFL
ncbi:MAG: hypothetical protein AAFP20_25445, partial [Cyanobacteria bacterium J06614_10]